MPLRFQDRFSTVLPADPVLENTRRQVTGACFSYVAPRKPSQPVLLHVAKDVAALVGLTGEELSDASFLDMVSGRTIPPETRPYAMCYGGHQFGHWAGQLGDGRAINVGEVVHADKYWMLQLKGAGETPYSRTADGLAVLRSSIREHLCSEAMYTLGVPTTRSLSLVLTGDEVLRDIMYDGHSAYEKGAVVCRVAPSFIRFGNFEILAARKDLERLRALADFTIEHYFPAIQNKGKDRYVSFLQAVADATLDMIIHWERVGFVHGVMNTDNMSIHGITIDYGPYGWVDDYDPEWTPNTTDKQHRRYRFGNQAEIALWNVYRLANALHPLVEETTPLEAIIESFKEKYHPAYFAMMSAKLGLVKTETGDIRIITDLTDCLTLTETDMTIFFRLLSQFAASDTANLLEVVAAAFYKPSELNAEITTKWNVWALAYRQRLLKESTTANERVDYMHRINPKYVLRNYMAQTAIEAADKGDYSLIDSLYQLLLRPYDEQPDQEQWFAKRPDWARQKIGCSMLSCSS